MSEELVPGLTIDDVQARAFYHSIAPHIVALLPPDGLTVGTGTLVKWKSSHLILTANHNLEGSKPSAIKFAFYPGGTLREGRMSSREDSGGLCRGVLLPADDNVIADEKNDIVAIPLDVRQLPATARFYEFGEKAPIPNDGNTVFLAGFAWDNSFPLKGQARAVGVITQSGVLDSVLNATKGLSSTYNPEDHFLLPYVMDDNIRPYGISGTGAWGNTDHAGSVWTSQPVLVGVQIAWFPGSKLLQIVRLGPVLSLLRRL
ncbi:MAG: hypothetical protein ACLQOO_23245 [Terriglobia bacterium]